MVRRRISRSAALLVASGALVLGRVATAHAHPIHTTLTEIGPGPGADDLTITVRGFVDDLSAVAAAHAGVREGANHLLPERVLASYVAARLAIGDSAGAPLPLRWYGVRRAGDVLWVTVRAKAPRDAHAIRVRNAMLFERYDDQVNIVQATLAGTRASTLFTKGEGEKLLR